MKIRQPSSELKTPYSFFIKTLKQTTYSSLSQERSGDGAVKALTGGVLENGTFAKIKTNVPLALQTTASSFLCGATAVKQTAKERSGSAKNVSSVVRV